MLISVHDQRVYISGETNAWLWKPEDSSCRYVQSKQNQKMYWGLTYTQVFNSELLAAFKTDAALYVDRQHTTSISNLISITDCSH